MRSRGLRRSRSTLRSVASICRLLNCAYTRFDTGSELMIMGYSVTPESPRPGGCAVLRVMLLASSLVLVSFPSQAQHVYVWRDADGIVNYSDLPPVGGEVGHVRKLRVRTFTASEGSSSPPSLARSRNSVHQATSIASGRAWDRSVSENGRDSSSGGTNGGDGLAGSGSVGGGASSVGGSGSEAGGGPLAAGNSSTSGSTTTASGAPDLAVPISSAPAPDLAVPIASAPAPDLAVPIATAPVPDLAVPISSTPTTATSVATTTPSGVTLASGDTSSSSTWSQIAGETGGDAQATLYWDQPKGPNIAVIPKASYRIYYGTASGTYLQPFGQGLDAGKVTSYTVQGLTSGTYYFAVTTQVGGHESPYSNEVFKVIP